MCYDKNFMKMILLKMLYTLKYKLHYIRSTNNTLYYEVIFLICVIATGPIVQYLLNQDVEVLKMNFLKQVAEEYH